ncbi:MULTISPECIES: transposase domain-containing protein, partial [unclassified Shigella]|uniref:transposase domain-containing protein n=1 Tax=unclassified Shigella TaxID=2629414 RepID=UPI001E651989
MFPDSFMHIGQALDLVSRYDSLRNPLTSLGDYLDPELISRCLAESGTVTLRKRRLPLEINRWEIELGYREIKQTMQLSRLTLRSKKPELVEQELWGVLLAY